MVRRRNIVFRMVLTVSSFGAGALGLGDGFFWHVQNNHAFAQEIVVKEVSEALPPVAEPAIEGNDVDVVEASGDDVQNEEEVDMQENTQETLQESGDERRDSVVILKRKIDQNWDPSIADMSSLFFTYWQHQAIQDAKNDHRGVSRPPTEAELRALNKVDEKENIRVDPEKRYVSLGGIVYKGNKNWTVWLNGKRVTPRAVPREAIDLRVYEDYIEVRWFDEYSNQVFPLRLRAHQRFNLDMRIFLPG